MHELSVCRGLLGEVKRVADTHGARRVRGIVVEVGPLSGVEAPLLVRAFEIARIGTLAEDATLHVETPPVRVWCKACDAETEASANDLRCRRCGGWKVELRSGDALLLKQVELETEDELAAAG